MITHDIISPFPSDFSSRSHVSCTGIADILAPPGISTRPKCSTILECDSCHARGHSCQGHSNAAPVEKPGCFLISRSFEWFQVGRALKNCLATVTTLLSVEVQMFKTTRCHDVRSKANLHGLVSKRRCTRPQDVMMFRSKVNLHGLVSKYR